MRHPRMGHALLHDIPMGDLVAPLMALERRRTARRRDRGGRRRGPPAAAPRVRPRAPHHWRWKRLICRISKPCESMMFSDMRRSSAWMPDSSSARAILIAPS